MVESSLPPDWVLFYQAPSLPLSPFFETVFLSLWLKSRKKFLLIDRLEKGALMGMRMVSRYVP